MTVLYVNARKEVFASSGNTSQLPDWCHHAKYPPSCPLFIATLPLNKVSANFLNKLRDFQICIQDEELTNVTAFSLVSRETFEVFKNWFLYHQHWKIRNFCTLTQENQYCLDQTRQYYFMIDEAELNHSKTTANRIVCLYKSDVLVYIKPIVRKTWAVKQLQKRGNIPTIVIRNWEIWKAQFRWNYWIMSGCILHHVPAVWQIGTCWWANWELNMDVKDVLFRYCYKTVIV